MRQFSGKGLATFAAPSPIDVTPIRAFAVHFHEIYQRLEEASPDLLLVQTVQEALLGLYCHKPEAFRRSRQDGPQKGTLASFAFYLHALKYRTFCYLSTVEKHDKAANRVKRVNKLVQVNTLVLQAFGSIYCLSDCDWEMVHRHLLHTVVPDVRGTHFMDAICQMLSAIGMSDPSSPTRAPP
ncbi:MAG: hypothetical protein ABIO72_02685 [Patescibacteria group bacterium]